MGAIGDLLIMFGWAKDIKSVKLHSPLTIRRRVHLKINVMSIAWQSRR